LPRAQFFTGTFVNPNHYGTYAGALTLVALALAFRAARADSRETAGERWRRRIAALSGTGGVWLGLALVLGTAVLLSASKGAAIGLALALALCSAFYARGMSRIVVVVSVLLMMLGVVLLSPGAEKLAGRIGWVMSFGDQGRVAVYSVVLDAVALRPMTGWGM